MFSMPNPGDGVFVVATDQLHLGDGEYRMRGEELPDAFDWPESAIRGLVGTGKIVFVPKPPFDVELVRALAMRLTNRELSELLETRGLSVKGNKTELVHRLLVDAKIERPTVEEARAMAPAPRLPRSYEESRPKPTPPALPTHLEDVPEALHPQAEVMKHFAEMSEHELRTNIAPLYSIDGAATRSKAEILLDLARQLAPDLQGMILPTEAFSIEPIANPEPQTPPVDDHVDEDPPSGESEDPADSESPA